MSVVRVVGRFAGVGFIVCVSMVIGIVITLAVVGEPTP